MENTAEIRQSTGKNIADFAKGVGIAVIALPIELMSLATDDKNLSPMDGEDKSLAFRVGYCLPVVSLCLGMAGFAAYQVFCGEPYSGSF
jgi:hypothetical protein